MASAQVFTCNYSGSIKNKLLKGGDKLFLKIEDTKISGKAFICNEEGRNGYIDNFEYPISEVREVFKGEYQGNQALIMNTRITSIYGTKKAQTIFPSIKDIEMVIERLGQIKEASANVATGVRQATTQSQPIARPDMPVAPVPAAPRPEMQIQKAPEPVSTANVIIKQEQGLRAHSDAPQVGGSLLNNVGTKTDTPSVGGALMNTGAAPAAPVAPTPVAPTPVAPTPVAPVAPAAPAAPAPKKEDNSQDFQKRMEKLYVMKDMGMLTDKEFEAKKLELVSELCGMTDFNDKVQKLVVLKECGMLSDKEFETRKIDIIKECCDTNVEDLDEYKRNIERIPYLKMGGMIDEVEFEERKAAVLKEVEYSGSDSNPVLLKKLQRWPILRDCEMLTQDEYKIKVQSLVGILDVSMSDSVDVLTTKFNKWPVLVEAGLISENEFKSKQQHVIEDFVNAPWSNVPEFKVVVERLMALKTGNWLSELDFHAKKVELLRKVSAVEDYVTKVQLYIALPGIGLISEGDYQVKKEEFIADIFSPYSTMEDFQGKVKKLMDLEKTGMLTTDEYTNYKMKLMDAL